MITTITGIFATGSNVTGATNGTRVDRVVDTTQANRWTYTDLAATHRLSSLLGHHCPSSVRVG